MDSNKKKGANNKNTLKALTMVTQFSINMLVPIFICSYIGVILDRRLGTSFIVIILFFIGAIAGFRNIFKMSKEIYGDDDKRKRKH